MHKEEAKAQPVVAVQEQMTAQQPKIIATPVVTS